LYGRRKIVWAQEIISPKGQEARAARCRPVNRGLGHGISLISAALVTIGHWNPSIFSI
jgi:hypothetical protein